MENPIVISILIGFGAMALVIGGFMFLKEYLGNRTIDQKLDRFTGKGGSGSSVSEITQGSILREALDNGNAKGLFDQIIQQLPNAQKMIEQADIKMSVQQFYGITAILGMVGLAVPTVVRMPMLVAPVLAITLGFLPMFYVMWVRGARFKKFGAQLCEALELVARALRAGHSLAAAMQTVATEMPNPIAKEFGRVYEEQNLGISIEGAMRNLGERIPNMDLKFFVTSVIIQRQTGGDLAEILDKIGYVVRERFKIMGMVQALTGEGRLSGVVLIGLPFILLLLLTQINPGYVEILWTDPRGQKLSAFGLVMMFLGAICIRKIINIKV